MLHSYMYTGTNATYIYTHKHKIHTKF